jgi:hypothetical protein
VLHAIISSYNNHLLAMPLALDQLAGEAKRRAPWHLRLSPHQPLRACSLA